MRFKDQTPDNNFEVWVNKNIFYPSEEAHSLKNQSPDKSVEDEEIGIEENVETSNKHLKKVVGYVMGVIVVAAIITVVFLVMMNGYDQKLQDQSAAAGVTLTGEEGNRF